MKSSVLQKLFVGVLFIIALLVFSFADQDSKKLDKLYNNTSSEKNQKAAPSATEPLPLANVYLFRH